MHIVQNARKLYFFSLIFLLIFDLIIIFWKLQKDSIEFGNESDSDILQEYKNEPPGKEYFLIVIDQAGVEKMYEEFKNLYADVEYAHTKSHMIGQLIYEKEGAQGIIYCDTAFTFGCYHGFFGAAIIDRGIDVIHELDQACIERFGRSSTDCQHGIGHGLVEYLGHDKAMLVEALEQCASLNWQGALLGCQSGAFMEFYFPLIDRDKGIMSAREIGPEPCPELEARFQQSCYYDTAMWWEVVYKHDYKRVGELCDGVKNTDNKKACFLGLGDKIGFTGNDVTKSIASCKLMPSRDGETYCRAGAMHSFLVDVQYREEANRLCKGLLQQDYNTCLQEARLWDL